MQDSPGGNKAWSHFFIRPDVLYNHHYGNIPGSHHTQCTMKRRGKQLRRSVIIKQRYKLKKNFNHVGRFVPGIFLKADLFGDGERKNNKDCSNNDGKFAVGVPVAADRSIRFMSHCSYHYNNKNRSYRNF